MYRKFISAIAAASIAITAFGATPAFADDDDVAKALAAILGIAVIGKIIHDKKKDKERAVHRRHNPEPVYRPHRRHKQHAHQRPRYDVEPRPLPRRVNRMLLPQRCFRSFETYNGPIRMFGNRCLQNNFRFAHELPLNCRRTVQTDRGRRTGFEARCMRAEGYRLARG